MTIDEMINSKKVSSQEANKLVEFLTDKYLGKKIRIIELKDPYAKYDGREGIVEYIGKDAWNDVYMSGTWGGLNVYSEYDTIEIID